jgi:hypothetical protein
VAPQAPQRVFLGRVNRGEREKYRGMNKYQWPASKLSEEEMRILFKARQVTKKSICELLKEAVHIAYNNSLISSSKNSIYKQS